MEFTTEVYEKHERLVYSYTRKIAIKYRVNFDELIGPAMELFCKAVDSYIPGRAKLSTYLYHTLKKLENVAAEEFEKSNTYDIVSFNPDDRKGYTLDNGENTGMEEIFSHKDSSFDVIVLLDNIASELSNPAQVYLKDLFRGRFAKAIDTEGGRPVKFRQKTVSETYNWSIYKAIKVQKEIQAWWDSYQIIA